jgi:uncharacterized protein (DUF1697 family)
MDTYIAFLRGINVGGKSLIKMEALREALVAHGLFEVRTYIQSGNIIFASETKNEDELALIITKCIQKVFSMQVMAVVFSDKRWKQIIANAPIWWGKDENWKHNMLIMIKPYDMDTVMASLVIKPDMEACQAGDGVIYQSIARDMVGRGATGSKLVSNAAYKQMTIRNYNTATKLAALL